MSEIGAAKKVEFFLISLAAGAIVFTVCAVALTLTSSQDGAGTPSLGKYLVFGAPGYVVFLYLMYYSVSSGRMPWTGRPD